MQLPEFLTNPNPDIYLGGNYVVLDFETTILDKGSALTPENSIVLAVWRLGPDHPGYDSGAGVHHHRIAWRGEYELSDLVEDCRSADFVVAHNAKFELQWLERCGLDLGEALVYDTQLAEYVIGGNRWTGHHMSLENIAQKRWREGKMSIVSQMIKSGICTTEVPEDWLEEYCVLDVDLTHRLMQEQLKELQDLELLPVLYSRCLLTPVLADLEKNGMQLDSDLVYARLHEVEAEMGATEMLLEGITGGINLNSGKQLGIYLYETLGLEELTHKRGGKWQPIRTAAGAYKTDADTIAKLKPRNKEQRLFLETYAKYKELYNELTKYLRKFGDCCRDAGGHLFAAFNQTATQTHRLSSTGRKYSAQFQNFPRAYKPLFRASHDGWLIGEGDGAQLEFRVAGHLGRDQVVVDDILGGTDIHRVTAGVLNSCEPDDVTKSQRQDAKADTFKPLYGGRSGTPDQVRYYEFFREKYAGVAGAQQSWIDEVLTTGSLRTEWGLRYYWPGTRMDRNGYVTNTTAICNYPVQAFATAEIIPLALVWFWHRLRRSSLRMFIVNTVHDSIIVELPPDEIEAFHELMKQCLIEDVYYMVERLYGIELVVPLGCGVKVASHWSGKDAASYVPAESFCVGLECDVKDGEYHDDGEVVYQAKEGMYKKVA